MSHMIEDQRIRKNTICGLWRTRKTKLELWNYDFQKSKTERNYWRGASSFAAHLFHTSVLWYSVRCSSFPLHQILHLAFRCDPTSQNLILFTAGESTGRPKIAGDGRLEVRQWGIVLADALKGVAVDAVLHHDVTLLSRHADGAQLTLHDLSFCGQRSVIRGGQLPLPTAHIFPVKNVRSIRTCLSLFKKTNKLIFCSYKQFAEVGENYIFRVQSCNQIMFIMEYMLFNYCI